MRSPAYRLAFHDKEFMSEDFNRPVRLQLELLKTEMRLREEKIVSTIVTFGGTRILEPVKARAKVRRIEQRLKKSPQDKSLKLLLTRARKVEVKSRFYD